MFRLKTALLFALVATLVLFSSLLTHGLADGGANHRSRNQNFGVSGGNVNDASRSFCCSGTMGALSRAELGHGSGDSWPNLNFSIYDLGHVV